MVTVHQPLVLKENNNNKLYNPLILCIFSHYFRPVGHPQDIPFSLELLHTVHTVCLVMYFSVPVHMIVSFFIITAAI